jgi:hypothetical protein
LALGRFKEGKIRAVAKPVERMQGFGLASAFRFLDLKRMRKWET